MPLTRRIRAFCSRHWRALALGGLFLLLYLPRLSYLVTRVWWKDAKYSHGFLIPLVSLWYLHAHRKAIGAVPRRPSAWGILFVVVALTAWLRAQAAGPNALAHLSMLLLIAGMVLFTSGWRTLLAVAFPIVYLGFAFPVPKRLDDLYVVLPLQGIASGISERIIDLLGIPVFRQGNVIDVPGLELLVEDACSGIHSLYSLVALGTAFVFLTERRTWERAVLIPSTVPIAILANVFRVAVTGILAYAVAPELAKGFFHYFGGLMVFLLGLLTFLGEAALLRALFPPRVEDTG